MQDLTRRRVNLHPAPALAEAVTVSRFWRAVDVSAADQCWPWQGDTDKNGYGVFFYLGRIRGAHELALSFSTGEARTEGIWKLATRATTRRAATRITCDSTLGGQTSRTCMNAAELLEVVG